LIAARVAGVSIWGPGLEGWAASREVLAGRCPYVATAAALPPPAMLPATERRRAGTTIRLALLVAREAAEMAGLDPAEPTVIFGSACSDGAIVGSILETLAGPDRQISPTLFHNSVHNAPAGYWTIATRSHQAVTSLGADGATFPAALLQGMTQLAADPRPVLVCVYDVPLPPPLLAARPSRFLFGFALALVPVSPGAGPRIAVRYVGQAAAVGWTPRCAEVFELSRDNPATLGLPLLEALACETDARLEVPYLDGRLEIEVTPR
jgi:hypothetical protein